jgi:hypothetical protein
VSCTLAGCVCVPMGRCVATVGMVMCAGAGVDDCSGHTVGMVVWFVVRLLGVRSWHWWLVW